MPAMNYSMRCSAGFAWENETEYFSLNIRMRRGSIKFSSHVEKKEVAQNFLHYLIIIFNLL